MMKACATADRQARPIKDSNQTKSSMGSETEASHMQASVMLCPIFRLSHTKLPRAWPFGDKVSGPFEHHRRFPTHLHVLVPSARSVHTPLIFPLLLFTHLLLSFTRFHRRNVFRIAPCTEAPLIAGHAISAYNPFVEHTTKFLDCRSTPPIACSQRHFCMSHTMARSPSLIALLFALIMVFATVNANSLPWMLKRQNSLVGTGASTSTTASPTSSADVSTSSVAPTTSSSVAPDTTSSVPPTSTSEQPVTTSSPTSTEAPTTSSEAPPSTSTSEAAPTSDSATSAAAPSTSQTSAAAETTSSAAPSSSVNSASASQTSAAASSSAAASGSSAASSRSSSASGTKTSSTKSSKSSSSEVIVIGSGSAATTIHRSTVSQATTITSALVTSSTERYTTTVVTVIGGSSVTTAIPTERVVSSTTGYATATVSPQLNDGGSSGSSGGGLSTSTKKIIGGVVGGIGGAILLGGLALVAWRMWGRRRAKGPRMDDDDIMGPRPHDALMTEKNEPPLARYHNGGGQINTASNF
ncbi:hypothetical protein D6D20_05793 [Aureobasidium pullulans]|uniref:Mid2 domain-containing protein n=1 Tax=Aureobasidium pullulans TaxID=5580 RepID=A0A4S9YWU0_AURPU|nr:hypothetical protein D6D20_05793 [Aureobasidium pullulans]THZ96791.1 hypothetical protein D6C82_06817 [Aureobasidium pullulans]